MHECLLANFVTEQYVYYDKYCNTHVVKTDFELIFLNKFALVKNFGLQKKLGQQFILAVVLKWQIHVCFVKVLKTTVNKILYACAKILWGLQESHGHEYFSPQTSH